MKLPESRPAGHLSPIRFAAAASAVRAEGEAVILRRMYSVPEHITMFGLGAGLVGSAYPMIMAHTGGRGIPCPLRSLTGVPCPFCGLTTATVALTHGHWAAAAATSPLAYLAAGLVVGTTPVLAFRVAGVAQAAASVGGSRRASAPGMRCRHRGSELGSSSCIATASCRSLARTTAAALTKKGQP